MRVAIMSDIHGFDLALRSVLADIDANGPFDRIVAAGDLCETGPRPDEVIGILQERGIAAVRGNTDVDLVDGARSGTSNAELCYGIERLGAAGLEWLAGLPFEIRITPPDSDGQRDDLLIVHANPQNLADPLDPELPDDELLQLIGPTDAAMIAFGHIHICYIRQVGPYLLLDVSAVGNPKNGDLSSKWGIASWNPISRRWSAELRTVPYPIEETEAEILACGVPNAKKVIRKLKAASYRDR
ncbi:MAG TPA: metallophosphoesterase family protein [Thermomicrobiales bacterium]|nr:metallophosphoesterase family protein [Thermomicrobiales bacterium]